jgi:hypothetical protein
MRGLLALATTVIGGSALAYGLFVAHLSLPWILLIGVAAAALIYAVGAYDLWSEAYDVAYRFMPTWEQLQARADTLAGVAHGTMPQIFKNQYLGGHMLALRQDYDRAAAAGHRPKFDRELIRMAELEDIPGIIAALDKAAQNWKEAEERKGKVS